MASGSGGGSVYRDCAQIEVVAKRRTEATAVVDLCLRQIERVLPFNIA
jgi:hypothetical protein